MKFNCSESTLYCLGWVVSVVLWIAIIAGPVYYAISGKFTGIIILALLYILYWFILCKLPTWSYLGNQNSSTGIYEKMRDLYRTAPKITLHAECWHYETRTRQVKVRVNNPPKKKKADEEVDGGGLVRQLGALTLAEKQKAEEEAAVSLKKFNIFRKKQGD